MNSRITVLALAAGLIASATANAGESEISFFTGVIDGTQEVPANGSPATGTLSGTYNAGTNTFEFSWDISDNLIGMPSSPGAHIHDGDFGTNGPVVFGFNNPDGTWPLNGSASWTGLSDGQVADLFAGGLYMNFHTTEFPGGEVRGQINLVPTPGSLAVLGLAGAGLMRRRR